MHALEMAGKVVTRDGSVADLALLCSLWIYYTVSTASWPLGVLALDVTL
jgi:hypothetical protein